MKRINQLILSCLIFFNATSVFAVKHKEDVEDINNPVCLHVSGIAVDKNAKPIDGVEVKLYKENDEMEWTEITSINYHEHSFSFKLSANEYYTIEISKPGYVTRSVGISTKIPAGLSLETIFQYEFEVELFTKKKNIDDYYLDFPVALISYDSKHDVFDHNYSYTSHIKSMIRKATNELIEDEPSSLK
jgi:hypothetical protein